MQKRTLKVLSLRLLIILLLLICAALLAAWFYLRNSLPRLEGTVQAPGLSAPVTVARDARGVPLISGASRADLAYATGYVHAQERFFQMDLLRRVGAGELSELFGPKALKTDEEHRLHRFRARAERILKTLDPAERAFLEHYVSGVNDGLSALKANPFEYALIGAKPRPWTAADSMLVVYAMYFDLQGKLMPREIARGWLQTHTSAEQRAFLLPEYSQWDAPLDANSVSAPLAPIPPAPPSWWGAPRGSARTELASADFVDSVGSNNWAVAGSRSSHGAAIVADDMHLGLQLPNIWYRVALQFPDAQGKPRRVVGVTLPGALPAVVVGSNGHLAWGYTNSYGDYLDLVALEASPDRPGQLRTPGGWETPVEHSETILIKGAPAHTMVVRDTSFGPVREVAGQIYAVHWLAHRDDALNANPRKLEEIDNVEQALAVANTLGIPAQNFVAGDDKGNIGWTIAGLMPQRVRPGAADTYPIGLDGTAASFAGSLAPADYPRVLNPADGQLSTANSRQLIGPGAPQIGDGGFDIGARNKQVRDALLALGPKTDVAGVYSVGLDDRAIFIAPWRERALAVLDQAAVQGKPQRAQFQQLLKSGWTGHASVDSVGYRLARQFMWSMYDVVYDGANGQLEALGDKASMALITSRWPVVLARLLDEQPAAWLPPGHADWKAVQLAAIDRAIADLTKDGKPLSAATWGERNTAAIAHPITMAAPFLKRWLAVPAEPLPGDANMPRVSGSKFGQSERMTVSPGREEQGIFNMPGGQSGHPLSPYFLTGHEDWVKGTPTPLLPGKAEHTLTFVK
ncbi:penicillin acylase family protein [Massilia sp. CF038]|uniref:penicillin acylase family protein n=1 Tax=Massilia sp. CF038 TaxID=1881045 RepID=UPI0009239038|nr:penicillin acylase family protein [Massilia sp. CF038]SHH11064.1 penicillin amidase [Massilia sp. CF038]